MNFSPTIFMVQLLVCMHVLMTFNIMPLGTTMALPVTSKPIESTVENLAWQAWIELPPEQKQQVKSRKVTPKSIFTLPLRVECPEGHKQVDSKCIPIVIGSNAVLIDLNALGLVVGNTPTDDLYDYDDMGDEDGLAISQPQFGGSGMQMEEKEKSIEGLTVELKPPTKDEPLKFNIFENKFHIFHEEPLEDYSALSNEGFGVGVGEHENISSSGTTQQPLNATTDQKILNDLVSEATDTTENDFALAKSSEKNFTSNTEDKSSTSATQTDSTDFEIDAISLPVGRFETQKPQKLAILQNDSSLQLVTTLMDTETTVISDERPQENDIQTLLQTESFLPLLQQATATTLQNSKPAENSSDLSSLTTMPLPAEETDINLDASSLNVDEEMTTMTSFMVPEVVQVKNKEEFTRSVTINPLIEYEAVNYNDNDRVNDTTALENEMIDELVETTTPIQLDETTIIETSMSLSTTPAIEQQKQQPQDLKELLLNQEQAIADLKELQRIRKGQKDQHVVLKKTKVEPVEVLSTTTTMTTATETATETVTPLLTAHNENDNKNDRFYYQHITSKQETAETQHPIPVPVMSTSTSATTGSIAKPSEIEKMPLTSEIDLKEELSLINELVKGIKPDTNKALTAKQQTSTTTTATTATTTTEKPQTTISTEISTTISSASLGESSSTVALKATPSSQEIWSKILPLLTTTTTITTTTTPTSTETTDNENQKNSNKTLAETTADISNDIQTTLSSTSRNDRNSKIIRISGFNTIKPATIDSTATTTTPTSSSSTIETSTENQIYEPYWWLPVSWRFDTSTSAESSEHPKEEEQVKNEEEEQSLLLRFWSAYAPKSS